MNALDFNGFLFKINASCARTPSNSWILFFSHSPVPNVYNGIQSAVSEILHPVVSSSDMPSELVTKLRVTLGVDLFRTLCFPSDWFTNLKNIFESAPIFLKMCWLKATSGAWCATVRMGGVSACRWQCVFRMYRGGGCAHTLN